LLGASTPIMRVDTACSRQTNRGGFDARVDRIRFRTKCSRHAACGKSSRCSSWGSRAVRVTCSRRRAPSTTIAETVKRASTGSAPWARGWARRASARVDDGAEIVEREARVPRAALRRARTVRARAARARHRRRQRRGVQGAA